MYFKNLRLPFEKSPEHWKSQSRISGYAGEMWALENLKCPLCETKNSLKDYKNNKPVRDFYCDSCGEDFQIKASKSFSVKDGETITSSAFENWYQAILNNNQPNLIILKYKLKDICKITDAKENFFNIDKNLVSLRGHRVFNQNGFVEEVYYVKKEKIDNDCLVKRNKLSKIAKRNGWQGSYLKIEESKFNKIFPKEDKNVCSV